MRILFYNWCPIDDTEGGGIAVYQRNVLDALIPKEKIDPYFLCSGFFYDGKKEVYIREEKSTHNARVFSVVNSPVYAPLRAPLENFEMILLDKSLKKVLGLFIQKYGPFDAIHFQTLEGLSLNVLSLKALFPKTKFVYSVHNYTSICPNVMLWAEGEENCERLDSNKSCATCMQRYNRPNTLFLKNSRKLLENNHDKLYYYSRGIKFAERSFFPLKSYKKDPSAYDQYRTEYVEKLNTYVDTILAVSERVKEIMISHGVTPQKVHVCYVGTKFAEAAVNSCLTNPQKSPFSIVYMGYMRKEKGFYFLLDALEKLDTQIAEGLKVTFATKITDKRAYKRIEKLKDKYKEVIVYDGYSHKDIPAILKDAQLGIVPVLWEDNLPQVAIEMISCGVPVLASSFGGASELNECPSFCFEGNNIDDFLKKIITIYKNRELLTEYWNQAKPLTTMETHLRELTKYYEE